MTKKRNTGTGDGIVVSKWLEQMWAFEGKHPFVSGSSLSAKSWGTAPKRKAAVKNRASRKPNPALMKSVNVDAALGAVVGVKPARGQITKKLWDYIKKNNLQDAKRKTQINADTKLQAIFGRKKVVTMSEMTKLVGEHIKG